MMLGENATTLAEPKARAASTVNMSVSIGGNIESSRRRR
jgi:hypothetical protein